MEPLKQSVLCTVVSNDRVGTDVYRMTLNAAVIATSAVPGQFVAVRCGGLDAILRRPFGVCETQPETGNFTVMYQVKGKGTQLLSRCRTGERLDVLGPLGNGFKPEAAQTGKTAIIGGGIGIFPLLFLARTVRREGIEPPDIYLGFRDREAMLLESEFAACTSNLMIATEDGSSGARGFVTEPFLRRCAESTHEPAYQMVYACGPEPMLRSVQRICVQYGIESELSLEQRMACGIGACLVCACAVKRQNAEADTALERTEPDTASDKTEVDTAQEDSWQYAHVCKDGPVFRGDEVIFE